jgi:hypothetical protein
MDMVGHEAEGVNAVTEPAGSFLEEEVETVTVVISVENGLTVVTPENDVVESAGEMDAWFACHVKMIPHSSNLSTWKPDPISISSSYTENPSIATLPCDINTARLKYEL